MDRIDIDKLLERLEAESSTLKREVTSQEGLVHLQEVMSQYDGEHKLYTSAQIIEELKDKPRPEGFKTKTSLDELTGGFRKGQVITMFAQTKHGKTETAMWMMSLFPELNPVMIPLEQSADELISQRLERNYSVPHFLAPRRHDAFVLTEWIEERIVEGIAKFNSQMVVIDHLGYIDNNGEGGKWKRENLAYRLGQVMKEIKHLATKWDVIIILLAHISEADEGKPPQLTDIGNSSDIKKESDTVISIWRKNKLHNKVRIYENKTMLSVLANRRFGKNGNVGLVFNTDTGIFTEDNEWVAKMEEMAKAQVNADETF